MTIGTLLFAFLFLLGLFISIFYMEFGAVAIMGLLIIIPVVMLVLLILQRLRITVAVDSKNPVTEKEEMEKPARAVITLSVENANRILPVTKGIARVRYENLFSGEKGRM